MAEMALHSSSSPGRSLVADPDMAPALDVEWSAEKAQFRVKVGQVDYGWFADTSLNKKAVLVLLREMYDGRTGDRLFTEEALAALLGSTNRQAVDGHMKGFREAEGDLLEYLRGKCKVDADVVELVWKTVCREKMPKER